MGWSVDVILFDMLLNPSFKMTTGFTNIARTTVSKSKFICYERFKLLNVSNKDASSIRKRLLWRAINKHNKKLQQVSKEYSLSENFLSKQLSTIDF